MLQRKLREDENPLTFIGRVGSSPTAPITEKPLTFRVGGTSPIGFKLRALRLSEFRYELRKMRLWGL